jgi:hypothetical protein
MESFEQSGFATRRGYVTGGKKSDGTVRIGMGNTKKRNHRTAPRWTFAQAVLISTQSTGFRRIFLGPIYAQFEHNQAGAGDG